MERVLEWVQRMVVVPFREMRTGDFDAFLNLKSDASVRWRARQMGFGGAIIGLAWALIALPISERLGISTSAALLFAGFCFAFSAFCWFAAPWLTDWAVDLLLDVVSLVAMLLVADVIDDLAGYLAVIWIGFGAAIAIGRGLDAIGWIHMAWIGATSCGALLVARADTIGTLAWLATIGAVLVVTITIDRLMAQTRALAVAERAAREESERISTELAEVSRHKSEFLAGMSHELRTPLNAIIGFSEVLEAGRPGDLNERQAGYVVDIVESGRHLLALIDDVLDLAKVEAGRMELAPDEVRIRSVLDNALTMVREKAQRGGIDLVLEVAGDATVVADERKVKQVVVNLLSNAVKFTPSGGRVTLSARSSPTGAVVISVADTGPGIAPKDHERIFEEYTQAGEGPARSHEGTGLGLPLARMLVELHGGHLTVDSDLGRGAAFTCILPAVPIDELTRAASAAPPTAVTAPREREVDPLVPVAFIARLGALFGLGFALASGLSALLVEDPSFNRGVAGWGAVFAVATSFVVFAVASRLTRHVINLLGVGLIAVASVGVHYAGPLRAYATYVFVTFMTLTFAFRSGRVAVTYMGLVGAALGIVLALQPDQPAPFSAWAAVMVVIGVIGYVVRNVLEQTRALAAAERKAREQSDRVSEELAVVSKHKSEFLAGMSHELRTPLNAIIGFSEVLDQRLSGDLNDRQAAYVADIVESGHHLLALINDVLDLAKVEAGRMDLNLAEVHLHAALDNGMALVRDRAQQGGIDLVLDAPTDATLLVDERKLNRVVANLLSNAVKFTPPGGHITVRGSRDASGQVRVSVIDTGPGVAPHEQDRIFEEFAQAGAGPTHAHEGTGLGLSLARSLVELHGGRLTVESTPGQGATFTVTIPQPAFGPGATQQLAGTG